MTGPIPWRGLFAAIGAVIVAAGVGTALGPTAVATIAGATIVAPPSADDIAELCSAALYIGVPVAAVHAAIIGAPLYSIARSTRRLGWINATIGGALTGIWPTAAIFLVRLLPTLLERETIDLSVWSAIFALVGVSGAAGGLTYRALHGPDRRPPLPAEEREPRPDRLSSNPGTAR